MTDIKQRFYRSEVLNMILVRASVGLAKYIKPKLRHMSNPGAPEVEDSFLHAPLLDGFSTDPVSAAMYNILTEMESR